MAPQPNEKQHISAGSTLLEPETQSWKPHSVPRRERLPLRGLAGFDIAVLLIMVCLNALTVIDVDERWHHLVTVATLSIAGFLALGNFWNWRPQHSLRVLLLASPLLLRTIVFWDPQGLLYVASLIAAITALFAIAEQGARLSAKVFFLFGLVGIIPITLYSAFVIRGPIVHHDILTGPSFIPLAENKWRISIAPWGETYHFTSAVGVVLLSISLVYYSRTRAKKYLLAIALASYFIFFSGARIGLITTMVILGLFLLNRFKWRPALSSAVILAGIATVYGANFIADHVPNSENKVLKALAPTSRSSDTDATSDRSWLWNHHMRLFTKDPLLGAGMTSTIFSYGDLVEGRPAPSVAESYYTQIFAAFGLTALSIIFIHFYVLKRSFAQRDVLKLLFAAILVVETAGNSMLANLYSPIAFFLFAYICLGRN